MLPQWKSCIHMFKTYYDLNQLICSKIVSSLEQKLSQIYYNKERYDYCIPFRWWSNRNNRGWNNKVFDFIEFLMFKDKIICFFKFGNKVVFSHTDPLEFISIWHALLDPGNVCQIFNVLYVNENESGVSHTLHYFFHSVFCSLNGIYFFI